MIDFMWKPSNNFICRNKYGANVEINCEINFYICSQFNQLVQSKQPQPPSNTSIRADVYGSVCTSLTQAYPQNRTGDWYNPFNVQTR